MIRQIIGWAAGFAALWIIADQINAMIPWPAADVPPPHHGYGHLLLVLAISGPLVIVIGVTLVMLGRRMFQRHMIFADLGGILTGTKTTTSEEANAK